MEDEQIPARRAETSGAARTAADLAAGHTESLVYVPRAAPGTARSEVQIALKPLEDGRLAMLVFTSLDLLVAGCGEDQPWVALPERALEETFHASAADVVAVDAALTPEQRCGAGNEPVTLAAHQQSQVPDSEEG